MKCDEFERPHESATNYDKYCTVYGLVVSHSHNVKIQRYLESNMTKFMKFYDSRLLYIPFKLFDTFPNIKTLDVSFTEILDVTRNSFGSAGKLMSLLMSNNNITKLEASAFMGASDLMTMDLSRNRISDISEFAFHGLPHLDKVVLSHNNIKEIGVGTFRENPFIGVVALDDNLLEHIAPEVFNFLRSIREVNLAHNRLKSIDPNMFQAAHDLRSLMLSFNALNEFKLFNKSISTQLHVDHNNLTVVYVNGTKVVRADDNRIKRIVMINPMLLETLELRRNNITDISNITYLTGLLELYLSHNPIGQVNISTFDRLRRLSRLDLSAIGLRYLTFGMFSKQVGLTSLDLSFNNLTQLNLDIFVPQLSNLRQFLIDGNNLTEIQGKHSFSSAFPSLTSLGVSRNRFNCSYLHSILVPPYLDSNVMLYIEPETSSAESSHVRDVTCNSNLKESLQQARHDLNDMTELQRVMKQSMETLRLHEQRLLVYMLIVRIGFFLMLGVLCVMIALRFWKMKRSSSHLWRRGGSIHFHSNATVTTTMEPDDANMNS